MAVEVYMPKMSDHMESGEILRWIVTEGQTVSQGQPLVEISTDKVTTELETPASGILKTIRSGAEAGALVPVGETIALIADHPDEDMPELLPLSEPKVTGEGIEYALRTRSGKSKEDAGGGQQAKNDGVDATPLAMRLAERHGIDLSKVTGSGPRGRIGKADILNIVEGKPRAVSGHKDSDGRVKASPAARRAAREAGIEISVVNGTGPAGLICEADVEAHLKAVTDGGFIWVDLTPAQIITGRRMLKSVTEAPQF